MQTLDACIKVLIHLYSVAVELKLRGIEQGLCRGKARHDLIERLNKAEDVDHRAVGHCSGDITRNGIYKRRSEIRLSELLRPCALAVENIAVALNEYVTRAEHVCQLADLLSVGYRLIERLVKVVRYEYCKVCVVGLEVLVGVTVYDCKTSVVVFLRDDSAGVLAEGAHLILERPRISYELALVQYAVNLFHYLIAYLNANADIDRSGLMRYVVLGADTLEPVRTASTGGNYGMLCGDLGLLLAVGNEYTLALAVNDGEIGALVAEQHFNALLLEILLDTEVYLVCMLGAEMTDGAVDEAQARHNSALAYLLDLFGVSEAFNVSIRTELEIDLIGIIDRLCSELLADKRRQISADIGTERELAVGECARTGEAGGDVAVRLAVDTLLCYRLRAMTLFDRQTLFYYYYISLGFAQQQLICGKDARRTCAYDDEIAI